MLCMCASLSINQSKFDLIPANLRDLLSLIPLPYMLQNGPRNLIQHQIEAHKFTSVLKIDSKTLIYDISLIHTLFQSLLTISPYVSNFSAVGLLRIQIIIFSILYSYHSYHVISRL